MVKNNYSSGRNDDRLANPNGKNVSQVFVDPQEDGPKVVDVLPCHSYQAVGQMNLGTMLIENIRSHDYFKGLWELATFEEVVDQTYYDCKFATPWVPGTHRAQRASGMCSGLRGVSNAGTPSTCYMLLFKMFTLQITKTQIKTLITHADSPYIRCVGFLYLRYVCDPKQLWAWVEPYLADEEKFSEEGNNSTTTIGEWIKRLLEGQEYHDTMLPRLPVPVAKDFSEKLRELRTAARSGESAQWEGRREERREERRDERREERREERRDEPPDYRDLDAPQRRPGGGHQGGDRHREYERRDDRRDERRDERREYVPARGSERPADRTVHETVPRRPADRPAGGDGGRGSEPNGSGGLPSPPDMSSASSSTSAQPAAGAAGAAAGAKVETAAEKLARLRAKQAARFGGSYLTGRVGGDYEDPAKRR